MPLFVNCLPKPSLEENFFLKSPNNLRKFAENLKNFYKLHKKLYKCKENEINFNENIRKLHSMKSK